MSKSWNVPLPAGAEPPYAVYVNGQPRSEGEDYVVDGRWLRFHSKLVAQPELGLGRKVMLAIGIGVYGDLKGDVVDLQYRAGGRTEHATKLPIIPSGEPPAD